MMLFGYLNPQGEGGLGSKERGSTEGPAARKRQTGHTKTPSCAEAPEATPKAPGISRKGVTMS